MHLVSTLPFISRLMLEPPDVDLVMFVCTNLAITLLLQQRCGKTVVMCRRTAERVRACSETGTCEKLQRKVQVSPRGDFTVNSPVLGAL